MPIINPCEADGSQQLPTADVIELQLAGGSKLLVRPSGTEPKIKAYVFAYEPTREGSDAVAEQLVAAAKELLS